MPSSDIELYGGPVLRGTIVAKGRNCWIRTPVLCVPGDGPIGVLVQGGNNSTREQMSPIVWALARRRLTVVCLSQSGAWGVRKSPNYYDFGYDPFVERDLEIMRVFGYIRQWIAYGSIIGAAASIALAKAAPEKVMAVIAVAPVSLIRQNSWLMLLRSARADIGAKRDFKPPWRMPPSPLELLREIFGPARELVASDVVRRQYLGDVKCPVLIHTGLQDIVVPAQALQPLEEQFPNVVRVFVRDGFTFTDPNSRAKAEIVVTDSLTALGIT